MDWFVALASGPLAVGIVLAWADLCRQMGRPSIAGLLIRDAFFPGGELVRAGLTTIVVVAAGIIEVTLDLPPGLASLNLVFAAWNSACTALFLARADAARRAVRSAPMRQTDPPDPA